MTHDEAGRGRRGGPGEGAPPARAGIAETVDSLIAHMNSSRRLYMALIAAAFVIGPVSGAFAAVVLLPGVATEVGPDYELSVAFDAATAGAGNYGLPENHTIGTYSGQFTGKMLGHHTDWGGNLITGAGREDGEQGVFYGEFVGAFGGERAVLTGEMSGEFTGDVHTIAGESSTPEARIDDHLYHASIGVYEGRFDGEFVGMFFGAANQTALAGLVDGGAFESVGGGAVPYSVSYVSSGAGGEAALDLAGGEAAEAGYEPRFAAYGPGEGGAHVHTDITAVVTAFVVVVAGASAVVLYVGVREIRFYRRWNERFERYVRAREVAEREFGLEEEGGERRDGGGSSPGRRGAVPAEAASPSGGK